MLAHLLGLLQRSTLAGFGEAHKQRLNTTAPVNATSLTRERPINLTGLALRSASWAVTPRRRRRVGDAGF